MLTIERLRKLLHYDMVTGRWTNILPGRRGRAYFGSFAGTLNAVGYWHIQIDGKKYLSSRLAWFYVTGAWPPHMIDHRDRNRSNDAWGNLRAATISQNMGNTVAQHDNALGLKGVSYRDGRKKPFRAQINEGGKRRHLGYFSSSEDAEAAYAAASQRVFGEFSTLRPA